MKKAMNGPVLLARHVAVNPEAAPRALLASERRRLSGCWVDVSRELQKALDDPHLAIESEQLLRERLRAIDNALADIDVAEQESAAREHVRSAL